MVLKLVNTSQKCSILGIFILDKVTRLRALLDPPGWCLGIYRSVPLELGGSSDGLFLWKKMILNHLKWQLRVFPPL